MLCAAVCASRGACPQIPPPPLENDYVAQPAFHYTLFTRNQSFGYCKRTEESLSAQYSSPAPISHTFGLLRAKKREPSRWR